MSVPEIQCFHIAVVVASIEASIENYRRFLGQGPWRVREADVGRRVAYGSAGGQTWELIEVQGAGNTQFHEFRDRHGEGVQHIGFWTPDIRASVEGAVAEGAKLVSAMTFDEGHTAVQMLPPSDAKPEQLGGLGIAAHMNLGFGGWQLEYISTSAGQSFLKDWLAEDYDDIITIAPH